VKKANIRAEEIIATFSSHIREQYSSVEEFRKELSKLLESKKKKFSEDDYILSIERNLVYFNNLVTGVEAFIDEVLKNPKLSGKLLKDSEKTLSELEKAVERRTEEEHKKVFIECEDPSIAALLAVKEENKREYLERIEFEYRYLFTFKLFLFEFISVLKAVREKYSFPADIFGYREIIMQSVEFLTNFYIGNVKLDE